MSRGHASAVRRGWAAALVAVLGFAPGGALNAATCWRPPVEASISDPFRRPDCRWCPGNRGIEYDNLAGAKVRAVATGTISFVGLVAGTRYLVVRLADGRLITYGNIRPNGYKVGDVVVSGTILATAEGHLHFGVRDRFGYIDPTVYLGSQYFRARLVPSNGDRSSPAPPPIWRCGQSRPARIIRAAG